MLKLLNSRGDNYNAMNLEQMQREGREMAREIVPIGFPDTVKRAFEMSEEDLDQHTAATWKAALNSILESGLLEEKEDCENCNDCEAMMSCPRKEGHNTLARDIKEFISNMDKKRTEV